MKFIESHISSILRLLNEQADYAVLRNYAGLPQDTGSRDIDLIITPSSLKKIKPLLVQLIQKQGWHIVTYLDSDRLTTFVCGGFDEAGNAQLVQWDFFVHTSVYGLILMDASEFLVHRQFNGTLYHVDAACEFLDKYLYNRAVGSAYPPKYEALKRQMMGNHQVQAKIAELFGVDSIPYCDQTSRARLLGHALWVNLKSPLSFLQHTLLFLYTFIKNHLCSDTGFSLSFTGVDGVGKTTVIETLLAQLGDVFGKAHVYFHFRPTLFGNLGEVMHSAGLTPSVDRHYENPHRGRRTGKLSSILRLSYYTLDYLLGYFLKVKTQTRITRLVLFDRYYTDIICDSRRSRIFLSEKFLTRWGQLFIPRVDYPILLTADTERILQRKSEMTGAEIEEIQRKIETLSTYKGMYHVRNNDDAVQTVRTILRRVFTGQHRKNLKRLHYSAL